MFFFKQQISGICVDDFKLTVASYAIETEIADVCKCEMETVKITREIIIVAFPPPQKKPRH